MKDMLKNSLRPYAGMDHIWWGVSVEDRKYGLPRMEHLRTSPAAIRFLSIEPLLEELGKINLSGISWVIVGGESGRNARPIQVNWVTSIRDQCRTDRVPFFFKQWGGKNKKQAGRILEGRTYDEFPDLPRCPTPVRTIRDGHLASIEKRELEVLQPND
jgi:protein gp37